MFHKLSKHCLVVYHHLICLYMPQQNSAKSKSINLNWYNSRWHVKVIFSLSASSTVTCQYPDLKSWVAFTSRAKISSINCSWYAKCLAILFSTLKSMQNLSTVLFSSHYNYNVPWGLWSLNNPCIHHIFCYSFAIFLLYVDVW